MSIFKKLTKRHYEALGKVFAAEMSGRFHQSKAAIYQELADDGYVTNEIVRQGAFSHQEICLTHRGRLAYCQWAGEDQ